MITLIEARNAAGGLMSIPLQDPPDGVYIANIDGLDPVKADLVTSNYASRDGQQLQAVRRGARNLVFTFGMDLDHPSLSIRQIRQNIYAFFMPKSKVNLKIYDSEMGAVDISGTVESNEAPLFTKVPGAGISVMCMDPDFYISTPVTLSGNTTATSTETPVTYLGSVETGINFQLNINRTLAGFSIYNRRPDNSVGVIDVAYSFLTGDVVKICTIAGQKLVTLTRAGVTTSILYAMSSTSAWINFWPGVNNIRVYADGAGIPYTITYNTKFGGL